MMDQEANLLARLRFRNGFLVHTRDLDLAAPAGWHRLEVDDLAVGVHPDAQHRLIETEGHRAIAFGEAFDPEGELDPAAMFEELHRTLVSRGRGAFLDRLDEVAGRFALLVQIGPRWEVFHDAMGSRSLFYHRRRPILASHVELIAEPLSLRPADYFIPFITSRAYAQRDVKYLPGLATPYAEIRQLTPNTSLSIPSMVVSRYWPRRPVERHNDVERATQRLEAHMKGLQAFLRRSSIRPILGLTGGMDSRGLFAALKDLDPILFTIVRSQDGTKRQSPDAGVAQSIAKTYGLRVDIFSIKAPLPLNDAANPVSQAFRQSTGYFRGIDCPWIHPLIHKALRYRDNRFVRGFGGEILRGFYQDGRKRIERVSPAQLGGAYDLNSGTSITRELFEEFAEVTEFQADRLMGYDPNDVFYWEHRMGIWGSIAMAESDIATPSMVGYNSRTLYEAFLGLDWELRRSRAASFRLIERLAPQIAEIETV